MRTLSIMILSICISSSTAKAASLGFQRPKLLSKPDMKVMRMSYRMSSPLEDQHSRPMNWAAAAAAAKRYGALVLGLTSSFVLGGTSNAMTEPSRQNIQDVQQAFKAFDNRQLKLAETLFDKSVKAWDTLDRPRDEIAALLKARGNVRCDLKEFNLALEDYNRILELMGPEAVKADGRAAYSEYPDTFVQRGLAYEGLGEWNNAINDYTKSIELWGGGRGDGINPYVLTFRGNSLTRLGKYKDAIEDYRASADAFLRLRDEDDANAARANLALAQYEVGAKDEAVKMMKDVIRRSPGFADMHVALAAHAWGQGNLGEAENEWRFTCENTNVGCFKYKDLDWVSHIRRWPPSLVAELQDFLTQKRLGGSVATK